MLFIYWNADIILLPVIQYMVLKDNVHHLSAALQVEKGRILSSGLLSGLGDVVGGILALILCQD